MPSFGKKFLSAFVDIEDDDAEEKKDQTTPPSNNTPAATAHAPSAHVSQDASQKFNAYFNNLFKEANLPGPDYFEFSKMVEAMQSIPEEKTRYISAFAGLSVQGLDKEKLLHSAQEYLKILDSDAQNFNSTISSASQDKVELKKRQLEEKSKRIQELTREINDLNNTIVLLGNEIRENEEKIRNNVSGYANESEKFKAKIQQDIQKINNLL